MSTSDLHLAHLIGALSHALDMTEGQPAGHCVRSCWIGMQVGKALRLPEDAQWELYYTILLKDLGCSSNAARICALYLTDDLEFKRDFKLVDGSVSQIVRFALGHTGNNASLFDRVRTIFGSLATAERSSQELVTTRCTKGASIAKRLRFSERVALGIHCLDEHWNGKGRPSRLAGEQIPIYSRIALLAQVVDVFQAAEGSDAAREEVQRRRGTWFDPTVVDAFETVAQGAELWQTLGSPDLQPNVFALEPARFTIPVDEEYLDEIAAAFGDVVDSKSPYTAGHSSRVALYTDLIAQQLDVSQKRRRWLHRGALLHDVGKLGVSNAILDKPDKLTAEEWKAVQQHARFTEEILARIPQFEELAVVAGAHHERLDGRGYPRGLSADAITLETRIITTADIFDAITAARPYRGATPVPRTLEIMAETVGTALDPDCFSALKKAVDTIDAAGGGASTATPAA